ncbi:hypothetical protein TNCV_1095861 [Trichonephila clavipes]|nr:hypothetical protein TNCV_1095861 [Trichonephila clavipes]
MKASSTFSPAEDSTKITLSGTFRLITEKNTHASFLVVSMTDAFSSTNILSFLLDAVKDTQDWLPSVKDSLCKMDVQQVEVSS